MLNAIAFPRARVMQGPCALTDAWLSPTPVREWIAAVRDQLSRLGPRKRASSRGAVRPLEHEWPIWSVW
jgi:hypothetical protein